MSCPFLRETEVRSCQASPFRTMIPGSFPAAGDERCSTAAFAGCALLAGRGIDPAPSCPFLAVTPVQSCGAAPAPKFIPHSDALGSCCRTEGHRYCDLYISWAEPARARERARPGPRSAVEMRPDLLYAPNHMWLDLHEDGTWHAGVDDFFAQVVSSPERVAYLTPSGACRPAAVVSTGGIDLPMVFPERLTVEGVNAGLRGDPTPLARDPYARGWLFEGRAARRDGAGTDLPSSPRLIRGDAALAWMRSESERFLACVHAAWARGRLDGAEAGSAPLMPDGGAVAGPVDPAWPREERLRLVNAFFFTGAGWSAA